MRPCATTLRPPPRTGQAASPGDHAAELEGLKAHPSLCVAFKACFTHNVPQRHFGKRAVHQVSSHCHMEVRDPILACECCICSTSKTGYSIFCARSNESTRRLTIQSFAAHAQTVRAQGPPVDELLQNSSMQETKSKSPPHAISAADVSWLLTARSIIMDHYKDLNKSCCCLSQTKWLHNVCV
jgi:hypothetical protein